MGNHTSLTSHFYHLKYSEFFELGDLGVESLIDEAVGGAVLAAGDGVEKCLDV